LDPQPIPFSERRPESKDGIILPQDELGLPLIWAGKTRLIGGPTDIWDWTFLPIPHPSDFCEHTHWLPASTRFLPARVEG
jgi:hypothetical protein